MCLVTVAVYKEFNVHDNSQEPENATTLIVTIMAKYCKPFTEGELANMFLAGKKVENWRRFIRY